MVREDIIREYIFPEQTFDAATVDTIFSDRPIVGEILQVIMSNNAVGSVYLTVSGTGEEIFRRNTASGPNITISQPRVLTQATTGSIANAQYEPFVATQPLVLNVGSMASGTSHALNVTVKYR